MLVGVEKMGLVFGYRETMATLGRRGMRPRHEARSASPWPASGAKEQMPRVAKDGAQTEEAQLPPEEARLEGAEAEEREARAAAVEQVGDRPT